MRDGPPHRARDGRPIAPQGVFVRGVEVEEEEGEGVEFRHRGLSR